MRRVFVFVVDNGDDHGWSHVLHVDAWRAGKVEYEEFIDLMQREDSMAQTSLRVAHIVEGDRVEAQSHGKWVEATVVGIHQPKGAFADLVAGDKVEASCSTSQGKWLPATVVKVADIGVDLKFDNGADETGVTSAKARPLPVTTFDLKYDDGRAVAMVQAERLRPFGKLI